MSEPASGSQHRVEAASQPNEVDRRLTEIQAEFQRQLAALRGLIISNNESTNGAISTMRREVQSISDTVRKIPQQQASAEQDVQSVAMDAILQPQQTVSGDSLVNFSNQSRSTVKPKKIYPLPKFGGNPEDWCAFLEDFTITTEEFEYSDLHNIMRIREAINGKAKETVQSLLHSAKNVKTIMGTLAEIYGRPELLIRSQLEKVRSIQPVPENKLTQLVDYANKVSNVVTFLKTAGGTNHISNPSLLSELVAKLPITRQMQWAERCEALEREANIEDFSTWLNRQRKLANMVTDSLPTTSAESSSSYRRNQGQPNANSSKGSSNKFALVSVGNNKCISCGNECASVPECTQFKGLSVDDRWKKARELKVCFRCLKRGHRIEDCRIKSRCGVNDCQRRHNNLLHKNQVDVPGEPAAVATFSSDTSTHATNCHVDTQMEDVLFQLIPVRLRNKTREVCVYAFVDDGANVTMLDWDVARELDLSGKTDELTLQWLNGYSSKAQTEVVSLSISGDTSTSEEFKISGVYLTEDLQLPIQSLSSNIAQKHPHLNALHIRGYNDVRPKMIISLTHAYLTAPIEASRSPAGQGPIAVKTRLGWIIYGPISTCSQSVKRVCLAHKREHVADSIRMEEMMRHYFETETCGVKLGSKPIVAKDDERASEILESTTKLVEKRYECGLLWKEKIAPFPYNYDGALKRLQAVEKKMRTDDVYASEYKQKMKSLFEKGYARRLQPGERGVHSPMTFFLPHFGVMNPNKPGVRIVFDAAAKFDGVSLNDNLLAGPDLNQPLIAVLLKFREAPVAVCGDIREMFLQISTRGEDQDCQRFLWREDENSKINQYKMTRMLFGATCSPTIAQHVKNSNAMRFSKEMPRAVKSIIEHHYVDDFVDCFSSKEEAIKVTKEVIKIHSEAGFSLQKIVSNEPSVAMVFGNEEAQPVNVASDDVERVLGIRWKPSSDEFTFLTQFHRVPIDIFEQHRNPTKREVLSVIMSVFDPFGFIGNFMITGKIIMQMLWKCMLSWEDVLPDRIHSWWKTWLIELRKVKDFKIMRCYARDFFSARKELHLFCDASEQATAVTAYWRLETAEGVKVRFVAGKANCAPTRYHTIPKLELQAAIFAVRLKNMIMKSHTPSQYSVTFWTDSHTVLRWIRSDARRYKQFVANRIAEILESTEISDWRWVPGRCNPADEGTRMSNKYNPENRWIKGPEFLQGSKVNWPRDPDVSQLDCHDEELKKPLYAHMAKQVCIAIYDINRFSNYSRLKRVIAWVMRFVSNLKRAKAKETIQLGELMPEEESSSESFLCRVTQQEAFRDDYNLLLKGKLVNTGSPLSGFNPHLDDKGAIRVKGRLENCFSLSPSTKRPYFLPKNHPFTRLVAESYHRNFHHINKETAMNEMRLKFWTPSIRVLFNTIQRNCATCKLRRSEPSQPMMSALPVDRVTPYMRPFAYTGLDYFGPVEVSMRRQREKRWISLFTCLNTRAVHLEIATDLSSDACLLCIRNFINRRGVPVQIRSDNGTNFKGIRKELSGVKDFLDHNDLTSKLTPLGIKWVFNTPYSPNTGGPWERLVQSVKRSLAAILHEHAPRIETLYSLLVECENIVNSRPLTHLPISLDDPEPLTPNHFLLGGPNSTQTPGEYNHRVCASRKQVRVLCNLKNGFWRRWLREYLPELTRRTKWCRPSKPISTGCLVLVCEAEIPRSKWKRGRVIKLFVGTDGVARTAEVMTTGGVMKRPVSKLAILDFQDGEASPGSFHGGGHVMNGNPNIDK